MAKPLRIFISSPGDVIPERRRAQLVIEKLAKNYARYFTIQPLLWEVEPMLASGHFQDQITPPSETDIVILIVWSRLGTPLSDKTGTRAYHGLDGRVPVTGTEWEFEDAIAAHRVRGVPDLLAYRKQADPTVSLKDRTAKARAEEQWDKLDRFWGRWFVDGGEFRAAFGEFADLDGFEAKLEADLSGLIERRIHALRTSDQSVPAPVWLQGSPFRGLETYRFEHAPIFFGRSGVTKIAVERLATNADHGCAFLLILGASGAGKSSLAQAGVLAALTGRGIVPGVGLWRRAVVHPGGHPRGPFAALADALVSATALPELLGPRGDVEALARHLRASADDPGYVVLTVLDQVEAAARASGQLLATETARLAIVVDQFEELFTSGDIAAEDRVAFVRCVEGLARSRRVFMIATFRSDYWHRASETPQLVALAGGDGRLDLLPPSQDEIIEMIRQPAQAAGLTFENDPARDVHLDGTLAAEAANEPGALPLLSFLLDELYQKDVHNAGRSTLTFASMQELGGLKGAIANRAETIFATLPPEVQTALPEVLRALATISRSGAEPTARAAPLARFMDGSPARRLIDALLAPQSRLLIAEGDGGGARIRLAHEALLTYWDRAKRQIAQDRDDLRTRALVEEAEAEWQAAVAAKRRGYLLRDPHLAAALDLVERWGGAFDQKTLAFLRASQRRARLNQRLTLAAAAIFALIAVGASVLGIMAYRYQQQAEANLARAETERQRAEQTLLAAVKSSKDLVLNVGVKWRRADGVRLDMIDDIMKSARDLQDQLLAYNSQTPELRQAQAVAWRESSQTLATAGRFQAALEAGEKSRDLMDGLLAAKPANAELQRELALSYNTIGEAQAGLGQVDDALSAYSQSLAILKRLAGTHENVELKHDVVLVLQDLALTYERIGDVELATNKLADASASYAQSLPIRERLAQAEPSNPKRLADLAAAYDRLAAELWEARDEAALGWYNKSRAVYEQLLAQDKSNSGWQARLAANYDKIGVILIAMKNCADATPALRQGLSIIEPLVKKTPGPPRWQELLALVQMHLADCGDHPQERYQAARTIVDELEMDQKLPNRFKTLKSEIQQRLDALPQ